jgi:hypothetical protein
VDHGNTIPTWTCAEVSQKDDEQQHKVVSAQGLNYRKGYMQESEIEQTLPRAMRTMRLGKHALLHFVIWLGALATFAAADSWSTVTGLTFAALLAILAAVVTGITSTTIIHEWFHFLGAWVSGGRYGIPKNKGLFVYDWHYSENSVKQFYIMSIAGTVGSVAGIALLWSAVPTDTAARAALTAAAIASLAYGACVEWPVLRRTQRSGDPLAELSKIDSRVLTRSFAVAIAVGAMAWWALT